VFRNFGKALTSLVYEDVPDEGAPAPAATAQPTPATASAAAPPPPRPSAVAEDFTEIDRGIQAKLLDAMNAAGAPLYNDLDAFLDEMADAIPDENMRWKKAVAFLTKKGHSITEILTDVDKCIGALEEHSRIFNSNVEQQLRSRVGSKEKSVEDLNGQLAQKQAQLDALQAEMATIREKRDADQAAISTEKARVERVQRRFSVVFPAAMTEVKGHRAKLEGFINASAPVK